MLAGDDTNTTSVPPRPMSHDDSTASEPCARRSCESDSRTVLHTISAPVFSSVTTKSKVEQRPLKPCLKTGARSNSKSSSETNRESIYQYDAEDPCSIRNPCSSHGQSRPMSSSSNSFTKACPIIRPTIGQSDSLLAATDQSQETVKKTPSCPSMLSAAKSNLANPATTRADVLAVATAPPWSLDVAIDHDSADPFTTNTRSTLETYGVDPSYEDNSLRHNTRSGRRRSSSASQAFEGRNTAAARDLERVNTILSDWSGPMNVSTSGSTPRLRMVSDDDGRPQCNRAFEDEEGLLASAPPNSQRTSTTTSRHGSRPTSAPMTRTTSEDALQNPHPYDVFWISPHETTLTVPHPDGRSGHVFGTDRRRGQLFAARKLSNIEEADLKFRGHRDSVTLAHSRLIRSGGASPELIAHSDSVSLARRRMHARNHTAAAERGVRTGHMKDPEMCEPGKSDSPVSIVRQTPEIQPSVQSNFRILE